MIGMLNSLKRLFSAALVALALAAPAGASGISNLPVGSAAFDVAFGVTVGGMLCRTSTGWATIAAGASGYALVSQGTGACPAYASVAGSGTVTSVALSLPSSLFTVSGSPVTASGTLAAVLATQTANLVFAGPSSGSAAAPTFRALASADLPATLFTTTGSNASDFSANGSYVNVASGSFTATGTRAEVTGSVALIHGTTTASTFYAYVDLYDSTAGSVLATGTTLQIQLTTSYISVGSMSPGLVATGLTVGHTYTPRLWVERVTAAGPTSINQPNVRGVNL